MPGHCSKCDTQVYEVLRRAKDGTPAQIGKPLSNAMKATFALVNGTQMDLTLCDTCLADLATTDYPFLWNRVMDGWAKQGTAWASTQETNGILGLLSSQRIGA